VQPAGRGRGKRLLYWFRTPPGVRVGRAPIDETAIRLLEQHNPDVQFDWTRILKAPPAAEGPARRDRDARDRDQRGRREPRREQRPRSVPQESRSPQQPPRAITEAEPAPAGAGQFATEYFDAEGSESLDAETVSDAGQFPVDPVVAEAVMDAEAERFPADPSALEPAFAPVDEDPADSLGAEAPEAFGAEASEALGAEAASAAKAAAQFQQPEFETRPEDVGSASYQRLGAEGLVRLRARYAEVMARIAERPLEEDAREELKQRAERLNPDAWVTADEVTAALEQYETVFEGLRGVVGRHPRRRRRGRR
jgi:hypothetical protein